ncbi:adenosine 3'-phospho 5'-phosphosulfate transporter 2-like [Symsagittifera roscoffensis]|uniref:adenosine 3'-phospho 5'-phosphosulfate transporter 2-like n=1 Tax=Symsagittifera roscoffensis TaxID=84072 RepID=UPI00307C7221
MVTSSSFNINIGPVYNERTFHYNAYKSWKPRSGTSLHFISLSVLVFIVYICYGVLQEALFTQPQLKPFGWLLTWIQFAFYVLFGGAEFVSRGGFVRKIPMKMYFLLAFLTVATMGLSNTSLRYLNYPTQVIFKSCKLIPVMIGGIFMQKKTYKFVDYFAMFLLCSGLIWFSLADSTVQPNFDITGIVVISCALVADAVIGNAQELFMKKYGAVNTEVVFYSYLIGTVYIFLIVLFEGTLLQALPLMDSQTLFKAFLFSLTGYFGVNLVLDLVVTYGALLAVTVTTCRKAVSIIISFLVFSKPFTVQYVFAGVVIFLGIFLNVYSKNSEPMKRAAGKMMAVIYSIFGISQSRRTAEEKLVQSV